MRFNNCAILLAAVSVFAITACSNHSSTSPQVIKDSLPASKGIPTSALSGTFYYLRSISNLQYPGKSHKDVPTGRYLDDSKLVTFQVKDGRVNVLQVEPKLTDHGVENPIVASFPIDRTLQDGVELNVLRDPSDPFEKEAVMSSVLQNVSVDTTAGSITFATERVLNDDTVIDQRYSFLRAPEHPDFATLVYPREDQSRFGFFKTSQYAQDRNGRITQSLVKEFVNHWDTRNPITYYLSKNFPTRLEPVVDNVFKAWNEAFAKALGRGSDDKPVLKWERNSGQEPGDLRYSMIVYVDTPSDDGLLGYGPQVSDPRTGQIVKADVFLYGGSLRGELFSERVWARQLGAGEPEAKPVSLGGMLQQLNPFRSLTPKSNELDTSVLSQFSASYTSDHHNPMDLEAWLANSHRELDGRANRFTTRVTPAARLALTPRATELTDEQLELRTFQPVLAHELGHTFGLRHNFEASSDAARFEPNGNTTSEMDYPAVGSDNAGKPGPYDVAALTYAYGTDAKRTEALAQNFLFCTDSDLNNAKNALCNQHDAGTTLAEVVTTEMNLYQTMYIFNNHRLDRVNFAANAEGYKNATLQQLLPLRLAYENANAIVNAATLPALWAVTRQRIEADAKSDPKNVVAIKIKLADQFTLDNGTARVTQPTATRRIDKAKLDAVFNDAKQAKDLAYQALEQIVLEGKRSESNVSDTDRGDLQIRGVLPDKMAALTMLVMPLNGSTPYNSMAGSRTRNLLNALISDTLPQQVAATHQMIHPSHSFNTSLRTLALNLVTTQLAKSGSTAVAREQLNVVSIPVSLAVLTRGAELQEKVASTLEALGTQTAQSAVVGGLFQGYALEFALTTLPKQVELAQLKAEQQQFLNSLPFDTRTDMQALLEATNRRLDYVDPLVQELQIGLSGQQPDEKTVNALAQSEVALQSNRDKAVTAYTLSGEHFWKAPTVAGGIETATGLLVRDNINPLEDQLNAVAKLTGQLNATFQAESKKPRPDQATLQGISKTATALSRARGVVLNQLANERLTVEKMHHAYQQAVN